MMIRDGIRQRGEFQITHAQELLGQREGYLAMEMTDAERYDCDPPEEYVETAVTFAKDV